MSGQTLYVKLREGKILDDLFVLDEDGKPLGGMKMANGTNSRRQPPFPGTRAKSAALVREQFIAAQEYQKKKAAAGDDASKMPPFDLAKEALIELMERKKVVHHHTHRHDDILTVIRIAEEFNLDVVLHHISEGWKVAEEIAASGMPCSVIVLDSPGGKLEAMDLLSINGAVLEKAGALVGFHTDDPITDSRLFLRSAAMAVRYGMSREKAIEALTIAGAKMLRMEDRVGSLEKGKDADFVILSGDPMSVYTQVLETWVDGEKVFDRSDEKDRLYAVGGDGATHDAGRLHVHELEEEEGHE
jgi:imidazolonepropionase-like amidohydrolase